ncbi:MAG: transketolase C-terminal domain-containing protein [Patescibacteria group bacterium]|jgi:transketolase
MRKQFFTTITDVIEKDEKAVLLLGDISVKGFVDTIKKYPGRAYNIGILEQATVGLAAGLAMTGFTPIFHTIAPFLIERTYEQLKLDFGYQKLGGNFISIGGSYDYAALGCTHHCPGDVGILKHIPGMEIVLPGTAQEFHDLFLQAYSDGKPTYFRLSEKSNPESYPVKFGQAHIIKTGSKATVIAVGPSLKPVLEAARDMNVTILYYTTVAPFDKETLKANSASGKILICEPYYRGAILPEVMETLTGRAIQVETVGVPIEFLNKYGQAEEHDQCIGLTPAGVKEKLVKLLA